MTGLEQMIELLEMQLDSMTALPPPYGRMADYIRALRDMLREAEEIQQQVKTAEKPMEQNQLTRALHLQKIQGCRIGMDCIRKLVDCILHTANASLADPVSEAQLQALCAGVQRETDEILAGYDSTDPQEQSDTVESVLAKCSAIRATGSPR